MRPKIATFDIDGTLTVGHGWYFIAAMLHRMQEYREFTALYRKGGCGEAEHLSNLLSIAEGVPLQKIHSILFRTPRLSGINRAVAMLAEKGLEAVLLTHNPQYVCEWYESRFGFTGHLSAFQPVENGIVGKAPVPHPDKVAWLRGMCSERGYALDEIIHVGDARSDGAVFRATGLGIAVNSRSRDTIGSATASLNTTDMTDVARMIIRLSE